MRLSEVGIDTARRTLITDCSIDGYVSRAPDRFFWYEQVVVSGVGAFAYPICCDIGFELRTIVDHVVVDFQHSCGFGFRKISGDVFSKEHSGQPVLQGDDLVRSIS